MPQTVPNPKVDAYFSRRDSWQEEFTRLRSILLDTGLSEDLKWGEPCYTLNGANIVLIHGFKDYCALLFFKGALMSDTAGVLIQQTKNVQAARQIRFTSADEISGMENVLKAYVAEAAEIDWRCPGRSTTGVSPRRAQVLPCTVSARNPDSSQK